MDGYKESELNKLAKAHGRRDWRELATMPDLSGKREISNGCYVGFDTAVSGTDHILGIYKGYWNEYHWFANM